MQLKETLNKILANAEETLDKMTGETVKSRAATKEKFKKFISNMIADKKSTKENKDESNN